MYITGAGTISIGVSAGIAVIAVLDDNEQHWRSAQPFSYPIGSTEYEI
jgi:hypothetical protein